MVKISVILVTYNSEKTLQRTINSIMNQQGRGKLFNMEIIVVDDCSTDGTREILMANKLIFFSTKTNSGGPNKGRNIALKQCTGEWICFIDHDDEWHPEKIMMQLQSAEYAPIVTTGYRIINSVTRRELTRYKKEIHPVLFGQNEVFRALLKKDFDFQIMQYSTIMISAELKHILFEESFGMVDYDWLLRLFEGRKSIEVPAVLLTRYIHDDNLSGKEDYRRKDYYYSLYTLESYAERYPREVKTGMKKINGSRARYYYLLQNMQLARQFFLKSRPDIKTMGYLLTSYTGSSLVRRTFHVFG